MMLMVMTVMTVMMVMMPLMVTVMVVVTVMVTCTVSPILLLPVPRSASCTPCGRRAADPRSLAL